jgi:hypothetical protein
MGKSNEPAWLLLLWRVFTVIPGPMMYSNISLLYMDCTFVTREVAIQGLKIMVNWPIA